MATMTPQVIAGLLLLGFAAGALWAWPIAHRRGKLQARRSHHFDDDESGAWDI